MYQQALDGFFDKAINIQPKQATMVTPDFNGLNQNAFKLAVPNIPGMDEHQISILVKNNINEITNDILSGEISYISIFNNATFIDGFIRAISSIPISYKIRLACNKLTYDYFTSDSVHYEMKQRYLHISRVVNHNEIIKLMSLGLDDNTAANLALCRYSSPTELTNVKRLNFTLYHKDPNIMTEQKIVWIYEKLFDSVSTLFCGLMFEVYTPQEEQDFGENFIDIYGAAGLAILDILNNMTSDDIKKVLLRYIEEWEFCNRPPVRFSLRSLSGDFSHITRLVEYLDSIGKYVP